MERIETQYLLFFKIYRAGIMKDTIVSIEKNSELTVNEKQQLRQVISAFMDFIGAQLKSVSIDDEQLNHWVQMHSNDMPISKSHIFPMILKESFEHVLLNQSNSFREELLSFHEGLLHKMNSYYLKWVENPPEILEEKQTYIQQLDSFSEILIQCNGTDELPFLLGRAEEIFEFKRCVFLSYNPWLKEFSGVVGEELSKVQQLRGKIESEPVFALKRPLFLKKPEPYVQQVAIDLFNLSSIIFIPIIHEKQLYGWLTFDQRGETFECSKLQLDILEKVGNRIGMYLARKQFGEGMKYPIDLTEKELAILHLLSEGYSNKKMAELMYLSEYTIRDYVQRLMNKLRATNRTQIISMAYRMGIVN